VLAFAAASALAADAVREPTTRHERFTQCAHESKGLKGDEHRKFMSECLKGDDQAAERHARESRPHVSEGMQHEKMRTCNAQAAKKELHGEARRTFMSDCLKG
jgi:hypothetical protein